MTLNSEQQKRLLAAEMAIKSRRAEDDTETVIESAKKWLEFIDHKSMLVKMDPVDQLKQGLR